LGVSRASLYYRRKIPEKDEQLRQQIERVMIENTGYGALRVALVLRINKKRVARVMKKFNLKPARRAKTPCKPQDLGKSAASHPNILRRMSPIAPNVVWASDFTFILYAGRFIFLCTVLDVFTGEILGSNISVCHDASFVKVAIKRAIANCQALPNWFHSDQGSEYTSAEVEGWLQSLGVVISMNPKGSPWCNGSQESLFGRFKIEFGDPDRFATLAELVEALYSQLHYHSNTRIKNKLKMAPAEFRRRWVQKNQPKVVHSHSQVVSLPPNPPPAATRRLGRTTNYCIITV
jgi:transposase InsO family protein